MTSPKEVNVRTKGTWLLILLLAVLATGCGASPPGTEVPPVLSSEPTALPPTAAVAIPTAAPTALPPTAAPSLATTAPTVAPPELATAMPTGAPPEPAATVTVAIVSFAAAPPEIDPGQDIKLSWQATGGALVLYRLNVLGQPMPEADGLPLAGSLTVATDPSLRGKVTFVLAALDPSGGSQWLANATASVSVRCPDTWYFANGPATCPAAPAVAGQAVVERFERGTMIWFGPDRAIYILYSDPNPPTWSKRVDEFVEGQPESDPSLVPPAGLYQPIRGFGLVWRDQNGVEGTRLRDLLGWAKDKESAFTSTLQCDSAWEVGKDTTCYLQGPGGEVIVLPAMGTWSVK